MKNVDQIYAFAIELWDRPYIWGGEGRIGYDCSGFVQALLRYGGVDPKGDQSAAALYTHFKKEGMVWEPARGALAFFGKKTNISHVGWCIDRLSMIHARGGGSHVKTAIIAKQLNASVQITPIKYRPDLVATFMPKYEV